MSQVRAVLFDLAGTLFDDRALRDAHLVQLQRAAELAGAQDLAPADLRAAYRDGLSDALRSVGSQPSYSHRVLFGQAFADMARRLGGELTADEVDDLVDRQYRATVEHARPRPDCHSTLGELRRRGLHVQVVSNIDHDQLRDLVASLGLTELLDAWTSSEEADSCKPDSAIFELALHKAGCPPEAAWFVGDTPFQDIVGAARAGMRTAWLRKRPGDPAQDCDAELGTLADLLTVLDSPVPDT